jgi:hypothetical protein
MTRTCRHFHSSLLILAAFSSNSLAEPDSYRFELSLDAEVGELSGVVWVDYANDSSQALGEVQLRLDINLSFADSMRIAYVKEQDRKELRWRHIPATYGRLSSKKGRIAVTLPEPLEVGHSRRLEIGYRFACKPALTMAMTLLQDDPYPSLDAWYPKAMSFRNGAWSFDDDRLGNYDVEIDIPDTLILASTGMVTAQAPGKDGRTKLRLHANKVRGFSLYGDRLWKVYTGDVEGVALRCFISKKKKLWATRFLDATADAITYYQSEYATYPCRHLDVVCPTMGAGHGSFAACNVIGLFMGGRLEEQYRWLVAHEVAHQYFGNLINQRRDEVNWVLIGLGMVMDRHYLLDRGLDARIHSQILGFYRMAKEQGRNTSLSQKVEDLNSSGRPWSMQWNLALSHAKGFAVCSLLEDLLGEHRFKDIIKRVIREHAGRIVTAADLIAYCEESYGADLSWFSADWIEGDATLDYAVTDVRRAENGWAVEVSQQGTAAFPVLVQAETQSGAALRERVSRDQKVDVLLFRTDEELSSVTVDPDNKYPYINRSDNDWSRDEE